MGMDMEELEGVQEVRIKKEDGEIVLAQPQVSLIKQQGMEIYQVIANPEADPDASKGESSAQSESSAIPEKKDVPEEDVTLVAAQANVSLEEARRALEENEGDLARAILSLKT
jgi:nascent polypeptide-associated complex subunit alpha